MERALAREPDLAEAHAHMGWIQMNYDWDSRGAQVSYSRALELAPGNAIALRRAGVLAWRLGRVDEALGLTRRALEHDPLSAHAYSNLGEFFQDVGRLAESEAALRRALELAPQKAEVHAYLSLTLLDQGRGEEALIEVMREEEEGSRLWALAIVRHAMGHGSESDAALRELVEKRADTMAFQVAEAYGRRGETNAAFEWLERAHSQRDGGLTEMKTNPHLRSLHGDPRWGAFLRKMGFEE